MVFSSQLQPSKASMTRLHVPKIVVIYSLLLVLCGVGYAKYDSYQIDGDAVAFMDIADAMRAHDIAHVVNGYWNPGYAAMLLAGEVVKHPSRWDELQTFYWVNFFIFIACICACLYFVSSLLRLRDNFEEHSELPPALSRPAMFLVALALLFASFQRELSLGAIRSDALLLFLFILAGGLVFRLQRKAGFAYYALLGLVLGLAYLTKSFAFVPSAILLASIAVFAFTRGYRERRTILLGVVIAVLAFSAIAGPYILAISKQRSRFTTGESARLNYAFFIDHTSRWHEWHSGDMGKAQADFKHHEQLLIASPPVYSYSLHPVGTYPLWFDPAYWTDTIHPKFYLKWQVARLARNCVLLLRFLLGHLEGFILLGVLLLAGCSFGRGRGAWLPLIPVSAWGLIMIGIYFPVDLQDRYLTGALLLFVIPLLAMLRRSASSNGSEVANGVAMLLAGLVLADGVRTIAELRRVESVNGAARGAYSREIYSAALGLGQMGISPGEVVACFGAKACYVDQYWARLADTPIRAEIEAPADSDPGEFWKSLPNQEQVLEVLRRQNIGAIVAVFAPSSHVPDGWQELGSSHFYALRVDSK